MNAAALVLFALLAAAPQQSDGPAASFEISMPESSGFVFELPEPAGGSIDFDVAIAEAVAAVVQERDPDTGRFVAADTGTGYFGMMLNGTTEPAQLVWMAASVADIWSRNEVARLCSENPDVLACDTGMSAQVDALVTAGVYAGVTGIQRLAKKYWNVDLDEGWKNWLIFGGMAGLRFAFTWSNVALANDIREVTR